jgi:DNA (cytosine-5)-methyltransferase 1
MSTIKPIPVFSFFTGGGFLDIGFSQNDFEIIWCNELNPDFNYLRVEAFKALSRNHNIQHKQSFLNTSPVETLLAKTVLKEAFKENVPEFFGVIGGPPCQDFSLNGKHDGFSGERGKLTSVYLSLIKYLQPDFFILENVKGLFMVKKHWQILEHLLNSLGRDYIIGNNVLNALQFGTPQHRERLIIIGINRNLKTKKTIPEKLTDFPWYSFANFKDVTPKHFFEVENDNGRMNSPVYDLCIDKYLIDLNEESQIPNANEYFNLKNPEKTALISEGDTKRHSFKRLSRFRYSPTACYGNNEVHLHPVLNRRLSVREALRIQGVPEDYILPPDFPLTAKFKMIGNGVPVPLADGVAKSLKHYISEKIDFENG